MLLRLFDDSSEVKDSTNKNRAEYRDAQQALQAKEEEGEQVADKEEIGETEDVVMKEDA